MEPPAPPPPPPNSIIPPNSASPLQSPSYLRGYGDGSFSSGGASGGGNETGFGVKLVKKKRGRPRKYSLEEGSGSAMGGLMSNNVVAVNLGESGKKGRGRPSGSGKKQLDALGGPAGISFTPHVILVKAGEDICSKITAFSQQGPRTICILSANGAISNASICHSSLSGATVTYEGRYEIISLKGSFTPSESNISHSRTGGLNLTLAGPDGHVLGGTLSGMLIAASPVQIIVGSFIEDGKKPRSVPLSSPPVANNMLRFGAPLAAVSPPISQEQPSSGESSDEDGSGGSPYNEGSIPYNTDNSAKHHHQQPPPPPLQSMPMYSHSGWVNGP